MSSDEVEVLSHPAAAWHSALVASGTSNGHCFPNDTPRTRPPPSPPQFQPSDEVEAMTTTKGLVGGWYEARIKSHRPSDHYLVVYTSLVDNAAASLKDTVPGSKVRRRYPDEQCSEFVVGEPVEVFHRHGWWRGKVWKVPEGRGGAAAEYVVILTKHRKNVGCTAEMMRRRLWWVDGAWVAGPRSEAKSSNGSTSQGQLQSSQLSKNPKEDTRRSADCLGGFPDSSSQGEIEWGTRKKRKSRIPQKSATLKRWIIDMKAPAQVDNAGDVIARETSESHKTETTLPFEKRSPVWKYIDLEVTPKVGEHPHFRPLEQFPEVEREEIAVGLMLTYESLMSNKSRLKMDSSCQILDEYLKNVIALEGHGFEVQRTRAQLEELRRAKGNHTQVLQKKSVAEGLAFEVEEKMERQNAELNLTDNAIMALNQVLGHFHDRRTSLSKQKDENESLRAELQKGLWLAEEELVSTERTLQDLLNAV